MAAADPDSYCVIRYFCVETGEVEDVWNARNGPSPASIPSRDARRTLARFASFPKQLNYMPKAGERILVPMTFDRAEQLADMLADASWSDPRKRASAAAEGYDTHTKFRELVRETMRAYVAIGAADIVCVDEALAKRFASTRVDAERLATPAISVDALLGRGGKEG